MQFFRYYKRSANNTVLVWGQNESETWGVVPETWTIEQVREEMAKGVLFLPAPL